MRKRRLMLNTVSSLLQQIITITCGFVLPRFYLKYYGSEINGLASSVSQFLGFISFMQLGIGAVVQSAWYKPLANRDNDRISRIYISAERYFKKIALIFLGYSTILCFVMPVIIKEDFDFYFIATIVLSIAISLFVQYFFGLTNQLLLNADQKSYVSIFAQTFLVIGNTVCSVFLMLFGASIQIVKLTASIIYTINPIFLAIYVKKHYQIDKKIVLNEEPIKQKWNGFTQHLSSVIMDNTDVMILTVFSSLTNVSIYYIYNLVVYGIRQLITSLTVGIQSLFGNMIAHAEINTLNKTFDSIELMFHYGITFLYSCVIVLICPFVRVYTAGINDANYNVPLFAVIIALSSALYCYRLPYYAVIKAAGHFKETQNSALAEMILNLGISIFFVVKFGLVGVAIGTLIASAYRTIYFVVYLARHITYRKLAIFIKMIVLDLFSFVLTYVLTLSFTLTSISYIAWIILAIKVASICLLAISSVFALGNIKTIKLLLKSICIKND